MKLYNIDGCCYCAMVRDTMAQMGIEYEKIDVSWSHPERKEVYQVSGQTTVPVLVDGDIILADEYDIIDYLKKTYPVNS
jgi:glutaredoxin 3